MADLAESLAALAVEETGFGVVADKIQKNTFAAVRVHEFVKPLTTVGVIRLGTMAAGIAQVFARNDHAVIGVEVNDAGVERGRQPRGVGELRRARRALRRRARCRIVPCPAPPSAPPRRVPRRQSHWPLMTWR